VRVGFAGIRHLVGYFEKCQDKDLYLEEKHESFGGNPLLQALGLSLERSRLIARGA
jgi:hypothetical protein